MTPAEMVTELRRLGLNAALDHLGRPAAFLPGRELAVIWPAAQPGYDQDMPEPVRLGIYPYTGNGAVAAWARDPSGTWTGLTAGEALTEITRHLLRRPPHAAHPDRRRGGAAHGRGRARRAVPRAQVHHRRP